MLKMPFAVVNIIGSYQTVAIWNDSINIFSFLWLSFIRARCAQISKGTISDIVKICLYSKE